MFSNALFDDLFIVTVNHFQFPLKVAELELEQVDHAAEQKKLKMAFNVLTQKKIDQKKYLHTK